MSGLSLWAWDIELDRGADDHELFLDVVKSGRSHIFASSSEEMWGSKEFMMEAVKCCPLTLWSAMPQSLPKGRPRLPPDRRGRVSPARDVALPEEQRPPTGRRATASPGRQGEDGNPRNLPEGDTVQDDDPGHAVAGAHEANLQVDPQR